MGHDVFKVLSFGLADLLIPKSKTPDQTAATPTPNAAQTVDPSAPSNVNNLGRAALIATSPQGVQGTDPTSRYKLLGNTTGLGN